MTQSRYKGIYTFQSGPMQKCWGKNGSMAKQILQQLAPIWFPTFDIKKSTINLILAKLSAIFAFKMTIYCSFLRCACKMIFFGRAPWIIYCHFWVYWKNYLQVQSSGYDLHSRISSKVFKIGIFFSFGKIRWCCAEKCLFWKFCGIGILWGPFDFQSRFCCFLCVGW